jgi:hypothetical protein
MVSACFFLCVAMALHRRHQGKPLIIYYELGGALNVNGGRVGMYAVCFLGDGIA